DRPAVPGPAAAVPADRLLPHRLAPGRRPRGTGPREVSPRSIERGGCNALVGDRLLPPRPPPSAWFSSAEADDPSLGIDVDPFGCRMLGKTGHADDLAGQGDEESCSRGDFGVAHSQRETARAAAEPGVVGERVLRLGNAHRQSAVAVLARLAEFGL